jgi:hypothetical protein
MARAKAKPSARKSKKSGLKSKKRVQENNVVLKKCKV